MVYKQLLADNNSKYKHVNIIVNININSKYNSKYKQKNSKVKQDAREEMFEPQESRYLFTVPLCLSTTWILPFYYIPPTTPIYTDSMFTFKSNEK